MSPIQLLANLRRLTPEAQRWLSRANNGTTDAYQEHLKQFDHPKSDRDPAEILCAMVESSFAEFHAEAIDAAAMDYLDRGTGVLSFTEDGVRHVPFDEFHGGAE